jgi:hypothetical protein
MPSTTASRLAAIGALAQLTTLRLDNNKIGDVGVTALAQACMLLFPGRAPWDPNAEARKG